MSLTQLPATPAVSTDKAAGYRAAAFSFAASTITILPVDTVLFDTNTLLTTTDGRITPKKAGYYQMEGSIGLASTATGQFGTLLFFKNGALFNIGAQIQSTANGNMYCSGSVLVYCNGTTDYLNFGAITVPGLAISGDGSNTNSFFVVGPL